MVLLDSKDDEEEEEDDEEEEEDDEEEEEDDEEEEEDEEENDNDEEGGGSILLFSIVAGALLRKGSLRGPAFFCDLLARFWGVLEANSCPENLADLILLNISRLRSSSQTLPDSSP